MVGNGEVLQRGRKVIRMTFEAIVYLFAAWVVLNCIKDVYMNISEWLRVRKLDKDLKEDAACQCNICQTGRLYDKCGNG